METTGKLVNVTRDIISGKLNVTFQIDTEPIDELNTLAALDQVDVISDKHREKRSRDANAYFHVLNGMIADALHISKARCKNILISRYGQQEFLANGQMAILKSNIPVSEMLENEMLHCSPCRCEIENGTEVVFYMVFRKSRTYNTKEMSILIEGTVQEAKDLGIETMPPDKLKELLSKWHAA